MNPIRFYPDEIPPFPYEPTRDRFSIEYVGDRVGVGVMTFTSFKAGDIVFAFSGHYSTQITQYSLQVEPGVHIHDPYFMGRVLHHCDPNTTVDMTSLTFTALRSISPGEFITMDYAETEDILFKTFECQCDAPHCRGLIAGRLQR